MRSTLLLAVLAAAALPSAAHAATVQLTTVGHTEGHMPGLIPDGVALRYVAAPGEANRFTIARMGDQLLVRDTGATIQPIPAPSGDAASQCTVVDATSVSCPLALSLRAELGDANDTATVGDLGTTRLGAIQIDGGSGDDVLTGGDRGETLIAGDGADRVTGGAGDDVIRAAEAGPAGDQFDGGPGRDVLDYAGQRDAIHLDLRSAQATGPGIGTDHQAAFEAFHGGRGDDELVGDDDANLLAGGAGDDVLRGEGGDDELWGELPDVESPSTRDRIDGGAGNDDIQLGRGVISPTDIELNVELEPDGRRDRVRCSGGHDTVDYASVEDVLPVDCEFVSTGYTSLRLPPLRAGGRTLVFASTGFARPLLTAAGSRATLGRVPKRIPHRVAFVLTAAGRRMAATGRPVVVEVGELTLALGRL